jgi:hypothetical protein
MGEFKSHIRWLLDGRANNLRGEAISSQQQLFRCHTARADGVKREAHEETKDTKAGKISIATFVSFVVLRVERVSAKAAGRRAWHQRACRRNEMKMQSRDPLPALRSTILS